MKAMRRDNNAAGRVGKRVAVATVILAHLRHFATACVIAKEPKPNKTKITARYFSLTSALGPALYHYPTLLSGTCRGGEAGQ